MIESRQALIPSNIGGATHRPTRRRDRARSVTVVEDSVVAALMWCNGVRIALTPQIQLEGGVWMSAAVSFELVHPQRGLLPPQLVSAAVRRAGLELLLFHRVAARTISLQRQLCAHGIQLPTSVPVPPEVLAGAGLRKNLQCRMSAFGLPPELLRLDVLVDCEASAIHAAPGVAGSGADTGQKPEFEVPALIAASLQRVNA